MHAWHPGEHLSYLMLSNMITCVLAAYREHHKPSNCKIYSRYFKFEGTKGMHLCHYVYFTILLNNFGFLCSYRGVTKYETCYQRKLDCKRRCCSGFQLLSNGNCERKSLMHQDIYIALWFVQRVHIL